MPTNPPGYTTKYMRETNYMARYRRKEKERLIRMHICKKVSKILNKLDEEIQSVIHSFGAIDIQYWEQLKPMLDASRTLTDLWVQDHSRLKKRIYNDDYLKNAKL